LLAIKIDAVSINLSLAKEAIDTEDVMKTSNVKSQERKNTISDYLSRHFGKSFWIMTLWCVSCTANISTPAMLPVTGGEAQSNIIFSPDQIDFGNQNLGTTSAAQTVTIKNDGSTPLLIDDLSISAGFSISVNSCPQLPEGLASQGTCTVEVIFAPSLPENWVGYLRVNYEPAHEITMQLRGSARSGMEMLASITH
jgi:hypothetical protein